MSKSIKTFIKTTLPDTSPDVSIDLAADILLSRLIPPIREFVIDVADNVLHIPRWQLILGSLVARYESGLLPSPSLDPSWEAPPDSYSEVSCAHCGKSFTPARMGQICCSNECGVLYDRSRRSLKSHSKLGAVVLTPLKT